MTKPFDPPTHSYQNVNFIKHLRAAYDRLTDDDRCTPQHVSLYLALFMNWNRGRFRVPMGIIRQDIMEDACIGSVHTYTKRIYELDQWGYLRYEPSFDSQKGTRVHMYRFDNADSKGDDTAPDKGDTSECISEYTGDGKSDTAPGTAPDQAHAQAGDKADAQPLLIISINDLNNTNPESPLKDLNESKQAPANPENSFLYNRLFPPQEKTSSEDDFPNPFYDEQTTEEGAVPRSLSEVKAFFRSKSYSLLEAERFYNYYGSIGWVGTAGTPIQNWRAIAYTWMLRGDQFK
jgi:hypothetical protein